MDFLSSVLVTEKVIVLGFSIETVLVTAFDLKLAFPDHSGMGIN
jgi:hypothetical protein